MLAKIVVFLAAVLDHLLRIRTGIKSLMVNCGDNRHMLALGLA